MSDENAHCIDIGWPVKSIVDTSNGQPQCKDRSPFLYFTQWIMPVFYTLCETSPLQIALKGHHFVAD